jgi:hypothetical protein
LGRQEISIRERGISFVMKFNSIGDTVVQSEGYDMVKDLGVARGLVFEGFVVRVHRDFDSFNSHIYE